MTDIKYYDIQKHAWETAIKPAGRKLVFLCLAFHSDNRGSSFPMVSTIASETNQGESTVKDHLAALVKSGHIRRERLRYDNGYLAGYKYYVQMSDLGLGPDLPHSYVQTSANNKDQLKTNNTNTSVSAADNRSLVYNLYDFWNDMAGPHGLPKVNKKKFNPNRQASVMRRLAECGGDVSMIEQAFANVPKNPHWLGDNKLQWRADFDWVLRPANFDRVLEFTPPKPETTNAKSNNRPSDKIAAIGDRRRQTWSRVLSERQN